MTPWTASMCHAHRQLDTRGILALHTANALFWRVCTANKFCGGSRMGETSPQHHGDIV